MTSKSSDNCPRSNTLDPTTELPTQHPHPCLTLNTASKTNIPSSAAQQTLFALQAIPPSTGCQLAMSQSSDLQQCSRSLSEIWNFRCVGKREGSKRLVLGMQVMGFSLLVGLNVILYNDENLLYGQVGLRLYYSSLFVLSISRMRQGLLTMKQAL